MKINLLLLVALFSGFWSVSQNQNISNGIFFDGEPYIAMNPKNSKHLVVAWMGYTVGQPFGIKTKVTFDGGTTWSNPVFLPHQASTYHSADPSLGFDNTGKVYACYIDYRESPDSGGVYVIRSTDGGLSWNTPSKVIDAYSDGAKRPLDRPWLSINPANNHMYITTKPAPWIPAPNRPYFIASTDNGLTWGAWRYLDTTGFLTGNLIAAPMAAITTSTDGIVHCLYPSYVIAQNILPGFIHARSGNDGAFFSYNGAAYSASTNSGDTLAKLGYSLISNPSNPNHLVLTYLMKSSADIDVYILESKNGGNSWNSPVRVNDDPLNNGKMQDLCWAAFDTDGDLLVTWRDRRKGTGTGYANASEIWGSIRKRDSANFSANFRISDTITDYNALYLEKNGNDFMCNAFHNDSLYAVWGDVRNNKLNIWFARKNTATGGSGISLLSSEELPTLKIYPNPAFDELMIEDARFQEIRIYTMNGALVKHLVFTDDSKHFSVSDLPSGTYIMEAVTNQGVTTGRFIRN